MNAQALAWIEHILLQEREYIAQLNPDTHSYKDQALAKIDAQIKDAKCGS